MPSRWKKEEARKRAEARKGLTPEQIAGLDWKESVVKSIVDQARALHQQLFPEDYDFMYDDSWDAKLRSQGINPMSEEYIQEVNERRLALGVEPFSGPSVPGLCSSREYCLKMVLDTLMKDSED